MFVTHYENWFLRILYSVFVQTPMLVWFRFLSYPLPQNVLDARYMAAWTEAQQSLATAAFTVSAYGNVPRAADKRALTVLPHGVTVIPCPDDMIANLIKVNPAWQKDKDPSGAILAETGLSYTPVHAFTIPGRHARVYAAATEIPAVLSWEFENIILARLGYDVSGR